MLVENNPILAFQNQAALVSNMQEILGGYKKRKFSEYPYTNPMEPSLLRYTQWLRQDGRIDDVVNQYQVRGTTQEGPFTISDPIKNSGIDIGDGYNFWIDGKCGLLLGVKQETGNPLWFAAASVVMADRIESYSSALILEEEPKNNYPVVVQLQGVNLEAVDSKAKRKISRVINKYSMKQIFIALFAEWANNEGYGGLYVLPAEFVKTGKNGEEASKSQYDENAIALGLQKEVESGYYCFGFRAA